MRVLRFILALLRDIAYLVFCYSFVLVGALAVALCMLVYTIFCYLKMLWTEQGRPTP